MTEVRQLAAPRQLIFPSTNDSKLGPTGLRGREVETLGGLLPPGPPCATYGPLLPSEYLFRLPVVLKGRFFSILPSLAVVGGITFLSILAQLPKAERLRARTAICRPAASL
jgi:hypothetical protein